MSIKVMSDKLANQIAAGEVVEKTYNVVKELVENAVDAGSTDIKILLEDSGLRKITVIDNGSGMDKDDALLSVYRHATSKIYNEDDLWHINTLGFRGEALASIGAVSHLLITTSNGKEGTKVLVEGGKRPEVSSSSLKKGTKVEVSKLFFNTPARYKFLKNPHYELSVITNYVNKIALSRPDISFYLENNSQEILKTTGSGDLLRIISDIYGVNTASKMLKIDASDNDYHITGYIGLPETQKATVNAMSTFVNGRLVRNYDINKLITRLYSFYMPEKRYPVIVINIEVDPSLVDVNIHPTKMDIKFSKMLELKTLLEKSIKELISVKSLVPSINISDTSPLTYEKAENISFDLDSTEKISETTLEEAPSKNSEDLTAKAIILKTYIVAENYKGLYLIDQHAAAERINFEKNLRILKSNLDQKTDLLMPIYLDLSLDEEQKFLKVKEGLEELGFSFDKLDDSYIIRSHPSWVKEEDTSLELKRMIDIFIHRDSFSLDEFNKNLAATMACKRSIKAGDYLRVEDAQYLIDTLFKCDNPYNCPHGRPTIITFTKYEIEKMFMRIMN